MNLETIYIDNHLIVVRKPAGILVQGDATGDRSLFDVVRDDIKERFNKPGNVYLGLVHRLDRPVSGVVVFARTSKAASRLAEQFRTKSPRKIYWALVQGKTPPKGHLIDYLSRKGPTAFITNRAKGKLAELTYERVAYSDNTSFVAINLKSGRHHQIRLQFASRGHSVLGDFRYGSKIKFPNQSVALHARSIAIQHPTRQDPMVFEADPDNFWPKHFLPND